jgi:hypothetical protein
MLTQINSYLLVFFAVTSKIKVLLGYMFKLKRKKTKRQCLFTSKVKLNQSTEVNQRREKLILRFTNNYVLVITNLYQFIES